MKYLSALVLALLLAFLPTACSKLPAGKTPLVVYCAAGLKSPVEEIRADYEKLTGIPVQITYGGSQSLLTQAEVSHRGDLYIPADDSYTAIAQRKHLLAEVLPVATMTPVLAVPKDSAKSIHTAADLLRPDVRLVVTNPDIAAIGKITQQAFAKGNLWDKLYQHAVTKTGTVNEVAAALKLGSGDAGFIWDAMLPDYPTLQRIDLPELAGHASLIQITVLKSSTQPTAALHFARFFTARDQGLQHFAAHGYKVVEGDQWADKPTLRLFCGAMLRPAVEKTLADFETREGVKIDTVYIGCGILVGQMKAGSHPDAYFACDTSFMNQVADLYFDNQVVSGNSIVFIVPKGNPRHIASLADLAQPGLRVGLGHETQSALGALTRTVLVEGGVYGRFKPAVESATGDFLINQLQTGSLDVVLAYVSNAARSLDRLETIPIDTPAARATQPLAIGKDSPHKQLMARLVATLTSPESQQRFESEGFTWKLAATLPATAPTPER